MPSPARPPATHILFDMDGVLLDTEPIYTEVTAKIVAQFGKTYDWSVKSHMIGRPALDAARYLVQTLDLPISAEDYLAQRDAMLQRGFATCSAMPGAEALVRRLHGGGVPMAVATSSSRPMVAIKTARHAWFDLFTAVVSGDDAAVAHGKPAPDIFIEAAARIGAPPASTLVFEDSPAGLAAGIAANMRVIAIPDPHMDKNRYPGADLIIASLADFSPADYGLPVAEE